MTLASVGTTANASLRYALADPYANPLVACITHTRLHILQDFEMLRVRAVLMVEGRARAHFQDLVTDLDDCTRFYGLLRAMSARFCLTCVVLLTL